MSGWCMLRHIGRSLEFEHIKAQKKSKKKLQKNKIFIQQPATSRSRRCSCCCCQYSHLSNIYVGLYVADFILTLARNNNDDIDPPKLVFSSFIYFIHIGFGFKFVWCLKMYFSFLFIYIFLRFKRFFCNVEKKNTSSYRNATITITSAQTTFCAHVATSQKKQTDQRKKITTHFLFGKKFCFHLRFSFIIL